jgi:DNA-binding transcriptional LysR family regulator
MAALPPFAQMLADMDRPGSLGSRCFCLCDHGENLPCGFHRFHYVRGNETWTSIVCAMVIHLRFQRKYPGSLTSRSGPAKVLSFSDYAVVVQAALLGQGITLGWLTVVSHWLLTGALVPASGSLVATRRTCELVRPRNRSIRTVATEIGDWIIEQMRNDISAIDRLYPRLGFMATCY